MYLEDKYKKIIIDIIKKHLPSCKIYLFGSRARKQHKPGSDFDLAVDVGRKIGFYVTSAIKDEIEETSIPVFVDIVDVNDVSPDFLKNIAGEWIVWKI
jgi:predicted nucleotidyltransferase